MTGFETLELSPPPPPSCTAPARAFTPGQLARIAACAGTPGERLGGGGETPEAVARLATWRNHLGKGDPEIFGRVLGWRGMDPQAWAAALATPEPADGAPDALPGWIADLVRMLDAVDATAAPDAPAYLDPEDPLPREAQFAPFVEAAAAGPRRRLAALGSPPRALAKMERRLLVALTHVSDPALTEGADLDFPRGTFLAYPVLARLLTRCWVNWIDATEELLRRLVEDRTALAAFLGVAELGPPEAFSVEDADGHDGGRSVTVVRFGSGLRVVYKPRDMALDVAFGRLALWLTAAGLDLAGAVPRALPRPGYGWAEFVVHRLAADDAELTRFWTRAGHVLGVLTALGGTDMHYGNVIAAGDRLAVVDLETVLKPPLNVPGRMTAPRSTTLGRLAELLEASALGTVMLPCMLHRGDGVHTDLGALSAAMGAGETHRPAPGPVEAELLRFHGVLADGFVAALQLMREWAPELLAAGGPLDDFAGASVRLVFRDTSIYFRLLRLTCAAELLRDGADRHVALERLSRMLAPHSAPPAFVGVVSAEQRAINELDIPRFQAATDGVDLLDAKGVVAPGMFAHSALAGLRRRVASLDAGDEAVQRRLVGLSIAARLAGCGLAGPPRAAPRPADALAGARALGAALEGVAVRGPDGGASWFCPRHDAEAGYMTITGFNPGLGDGTLGVTLFVAALARATGDPSALGLRDAAVAVLKPRSGEDPGYRSLVTPSLGLAEGIGGQVWGSAALARLGGPTWCLDAAAAALERGFAAAPDDKWTLADGASGLLLAALSLRAVAPGAVDDDRARALARRCAVGIDAAGAAKAGLFTGLTGAGLALALAAVRLDLPELRVTAVRALLAGAPDGAGWGKGLAGCLLARGAALDALGEVEALAAQRDADADALPAVLDEDEAALACDGVWRGGAGVLAALAASGRAGLVARAARMAAALAGHAASGTLRPVAPALPGVLLPGMLNGVAGIGLVLLRDALSHAGGPSSPDPLLFT